MYARILARMRRLVLEQRYVATIHAVDEMDADELTVYDLESVILTGEIIERQTDVSEFKYRIRGQSLDDSDVEIVAKISVTGKLVFITVYAL